MTASSQPDRDLPPRGRSDDDDGDGDGERARCSCHGEPMYWQKNSHLIAGGGWECAVRRRAKSRAHYQKVREKRCAQMREKYNTDPLFRLNKTFRRVLRDRNGRINRLQEELDGPLQI